ncbi:MAG TPA: histidine kinase, partial [Treponema sp.]|nr:histidine kinase [Treponema sp.]
MFKKFRFPISLQISIFLIIVAFIPIAAMLVLKTYENQLLSLTESSNVQQARLCAASLSAIDDTEVSQEAAQNILRNMKGRFDARIRILDAKGTLLADSSNPDFVPQVDEQEQGETSVTQNTVQADESFIYRLFSIPVRIYRKLKAPTASYSTADYYSGKHIYDGTEIKAALDGRYGSATRISSGGQVSVTLYSAVPVVGRDRVTGVVLVSRSTYRILQNLYELRVDIGKVFLWSLLAVALIATFLALRISRPLRKLSKQTVRCADKNGHIVSTDFTGVKRRDEVGDLSRSFTQLIKKLNARIRYTEAFSADVSHEFKNPLAAIRSSAELLQDTSISQQEHKQFTDAILDEVTHLQSLLTGVRRISRIDGGIEQELQEEIDVQTFIQNVSARVQKAYPQTCITTELSQTKTAKL